MVLCASEGAAVVFSPKNRISTFSVKDNASGDMQHLIANYEYICYFGSGAFRRIEPHTLCGCF